MKRTTYIIIASLGLTVTAAYAGIGKRIVEFVYARDLFFGFPVIQRLWVPHAGQQDYGITYIVAKGNEAALTNVVKDATNYTIVATDSTDPSHQHTACAVRWWTPPVNARTRIFEVRIDNAPSASGHHYRFETLVSAKEELVFVEQRRLSTDILRKGHTEHHPAPYPEPRTVQER